MDATARAHDDRVVLTWPDGRSDELPHVWLRDNCVCAECRDPDAWERRLDTVTLPEGLVPARVAVDDGLVVDWPDGHRTVLSASWLAAHAPGRTAPEPTEATGVPWDAAIAEQPPEIAHEELADDAHLLRWLRLIRDYGFALVRDVPTDAKAVVGLAERVAFVQETNFGHTFEVVSKPDPENLAYTAHRLYAHTDIPNRHSAVNLQLLHCLENSAEGGESILVDGFEAARRLEQQDPEAYELLRTVWVPWRFQDETTDIANRFPVIGTDDRGRLLEIRFNTAILAPLDLEPDLLVRYYDALRAFGRIVRDPDLEYRFRMAPGDCQVFDNQRVLHARGAFDPSSGHRHLQGCYVDKDDFRGRLRALERDGADFRTR